MKNKPDIDELLNSYLDGELGPREMTEVGRVLRNDKEMAERAEHLRKVKGLVGAMPEQEAPTGLADEVVARLERRVLLGDEQAHEESRRGERHLLLRRVVGLAALFAMAGILVSVVSVIVGDGEQAQPLVMRDLQGTVLEAPGGSDSQTGGLRLMAANDAAEAAADKVSAVGEFASGRLELRTATLMAADTFVARAIEEAGLTARERWGGDGGQIVYDVSCDGEQAAVMVASLGSIWERFDSGRFVLEAGDEEVVVNSAKPGQVGEILAQNNAEAVTKAARYFAVVNDADSGLVPVLAQGDAEISRMRIPKPVLTSERLADEGSETGRIRLQIVLSEVE